MKKIWKYSFVLLAGLSLTVACSKEAAPSADENVIDPSEQTEPGQPQKMVTITVSMPEDGLTRVAFEQDPENPDGAVKLTWEEADKILVNGEEFTLVSGAGTQTAGFSGPEVTGNSYTIAYNGGEFGATQRQAADADTGHLAYTVSLADVNTYQDVEFTQAWATAHGGGTLTQSSIFRLRAQMPAGVAEDVVAVKIVAKDADDAPVNIFYGGNELTVMIDAAGDAGEDGILDIYANLPTTAAAIPAGTAFFVRFMTTARGSVYSYTRYHVFSSALELTPGKVNALKLNCTATDKHAGLKSYCDGTTAAKAYLIGDAYQMDAMHKLMVRGETKYFKLIDNIDMKGIVWFPLNNGYPESGGEKYTGDVYNKFVNFDGNSKTISNLETKSADITASDEYAALFGVLIGEVHHLTIDHATIHPKSKSGILAGWIGVHSSYSLACNVHDITISNSTAKNGGAYLGALAGQVGGNNGATIFNITVTDCTISSTGHAAGLVAYFSRAATVSDIAVQGTDISSTGEANDSGCAGGISAYVAAAVDFDRCTYKKNLSTNKTSTLTGPKCTKDNTASQSSRYVGGIAGYVGNVAATFDDCHVNTIEINLNAAGGDNNYRYMGGAFGGVEGAVVIGNTTGCTVTGLSTGSNVRNYVGGFIGINNGGTIKNSSAAGDISGNQGGRGGFVGFSHGGTYVNNSTSVNVSGAANLGGFVGIQDLPGSFTHCSSSGNVIGSGGYIGGFCGQIGSGAVNFTGIFSNCSVYNTGGEIAIGGKGSAIGGFIGWVGHNTYSGNTGTIEKCFVKNAKITSEGGAYVGGFAGVAKTDISTSWVDGVKITSNKNTAGGFVGYLTSATISDCYSKGIEMNITNNKVGGFVGNMSNAAAKVQRSYADVTNITCSYAYGGFAGAMTGIVEKCIAWHVHDFHDGSVAIPAGNTDNYTKSASETGTILSHAKESPRSWDFSTIWNEVNPPTLK